VLRVLRFGWFVFFARCEYWGWLIWVFFAYGIEGGRIKGWSGLKKIILGARQHILDGAVREILAEEAGRKTITEWRVSTNSVMLGETWQIMGLILHTNSGKAAINGFSGSRRGGLILDLAALRWSIERGGNNRWLCFLLRRVRRSAIYSWQWN